MSEIENNKLPILPLQDIVIFPDVIVPLYVGTDQSITAVQAAMIQEKKIVLVTQKNLTNNIMTLDDVFLVGVVGRILQFLVLPNKTIKILIQGECRVNLLDIYQSEEIMYSHIRYYPVIHENSNETKKIRELLKKQAQKLEETTNYITKNVVKSLDSINQLSVVVNTISYHLPIELMEKQQLLEEKNDGAQVKYLFHKIGCFLDYSDIENQIKDQTQKKIEESQKNYYLSEQMKVIQKELGNINYHQDDGEALKEKIESYDLTKEAKSKALLELKKYLLMQPISAEATVVRNYIDWLLLVPWVKKTRISYDIQKAKKILDKYHFGLDKVKERIIEFLAVQKRLKTIKGSVLCLNGPPGVGKTSLGKAIAAATNRKFIRISLGGVNDEAEIRGHRKTYIGSMPGKIIQKIAKVGVINPLILLDEIDKIDVNSRGNAASALLEVLDSEQNTTFNDHYLEMDYDLSHVMFICTSNTLNLSQALLDRLEVINIPSYTENEKLNIAQQYLIPQQMKKTGLKSSEITIDKSVLLDVIRYYTREAGVRNLDREIAKICRKALVRITNEDSLKSIDIASLDVENFLGVERFQYGVVEKQDTIGQVTGLAWTESGGEVLTIEATILLGKGDVIKTGSLGEVMQESIQTALTVVRSRADKLKIDSSSYEKNDLHIHVPEGAKPKDGPSAGITMCTAIASAWKKIPVKSDIAMTGEVTLRGKVLAIGGLKEKLLAAHRSGIKRVLIPKENARELKDMPNIIKADLVIIPVDTIDQVLDIALKLPETKHIASMGSIEIQKNSIISSITTDY